MNNELFGLAAIETAALFLGIWLAFRIVPAIPSNWKAWIWRLGFLKAALGLIPLFAMTVHVLPAHSVTQNEAPSARVVRDLLTSAEPLPTISPRGKALRYPPSGQESNPLFLIWALGAGVTCAIGIAGSIRAGLIVRRAFPIEDGAVNRTLEELVAKAGCAKPRLVNSAEVDGAMLVGGLRPTIVLPKRGTFDAEDIKLMLAHEVAHLVRRDLLWFVAIWAVQMVLFFNPVVWIAAYCSRRDHESATDGLAIDLAGTQVQTYADMLVRTTVVTRMSLAPGALSMPETYRNVQQRLRTMKYCRNKPSPWIKSAAFAVALIAILSIPTYIPAAVVGPEKPIPGAPILVPRPLGVSRSDLMWIQQSPAGKERVASLDFKDIDVQTALKMIANLWKIRMEVDPRIWGWVNVKLEKVTLQVALDNVLRQVGGSFVVNQGVYKVAWGIGGRRPNVVYRFAPGSGMDNLFVVDPAADLVTCDSHGLDAVKVLQKLFEAGGKAYYIAPEIQGTVTMSLKNVSFDAAVTAVVRQVGAAMEKRKGEYFILSPSEPSSFVHAAGPPNLVLSYKFKDYDVRDVLRSLFKSAGKSMVLEGNVQGTVSVDGTGVSLETALAAVLKQVDSTFVVKNGVYVISKISRTPWKGAGR